MPGIPLSLAIETADADKLEGSKWASDEYINLMTNAFDSKNKCLFKGQEKDSRIKFGMRADTEEKYDIKHGFITLPGLVISLSSFLLGLTEFSAPLWRDFLRTRATSRLTLS